MEGICGLDKGTEMDHNVVRRLLQSLGYQQEPTASSCKVRNKPSGSIIRVDVEFLTSRENFNFSKKIVFNGVSLLQIM